MINDRINLLSGRSSAGYALVTAIKTVAILFVIILAVQGVFHLPYYFCGLCGYFVDVSCVNITLMKIPLFLSGFSVSSGTYSRNRSKPSDLA